MYYIYVSRDGRKNYWDEYKKVYICKKHFKSYKKAIEWLNKNIYFECEDALIEMFYKEINNATK